MTILNTEQVVVQSVWGFSWLGVTFGIFCLICFIGTIIEIVDGDDSPFPFIACICCAVICFVGFATGKDIHTTQYEIICEDDFEYPQDYVAEHKFIEKRGDIWVWQDILPEEEPNGDSE